MVENTGNVLILNEILPIRITKNNQIWWQADYPIEFLPPYGKQAITINIKSNWQSDSGDYKLSVDTPYDQESYEFKLKAIIPFDILMWIPSVLIGSSLWYLSYKLTHNLLRQRLQLKHDRKISISADPKIA